MKASPARNAGRLKPAPTKDRPGAPSEYGATGVSRSDTSGAASDRETRERLLASAMRLFADRGFRKVTVREICRDARANVAAVNYHFGDKLGLYGQVLQVAIDAIQATTEAARQAGDGQTAEEKLRRYIDIFVHRLLGAGGTAATLHRIIVREMNDATPTLDVFVERAIRPRVKYLSGVVAEMIGCEPTDPRVLRCVGSIQTQTIAYLPNPIASRLGLAHKPGADHLDAIARHITEFSIAGIRAIARER